MTSLRGALYAWRDEEASRRGAPLYRILPSSALDEIVKTLPRTKEQLTAIKGIKDAKYHAYGKEILSLVDKFCSGSQEEDGAVEADIPPEDHSVYSVSAYLDLVNHSLWKISARVVGEVTSMKEQGRAIYFTIKDKKDESIMNVFMWSADFALSGVAMEPGMEVIVEGKSEIYKPSGRFSFRAETLELLGEGALKKAYDELKKKLEAEGLFALDRKRPLSEFPQRIGVITSKQGAVIHDFLSNLGTYGYKVRLTDARVEGAQAVKEILSALSYWSGEDIDVLVIIRGGGSMESLQAFNNERVVRAIANSPVPVICAIGHDKDVPLAQLSADFAPSTPTACTALLNRSWEEAQYSIRTTMEGIIASYEKQLSASRDTLNFSADALRRAFYAIRESVFVAEKNFQSSLSRVRDALSEHERSLGRYSGEHLTFFATALREAGKTLQHMAHTIGNNDPMRQLSLGYSILLKEGKLIRSVTGVKPGERFEAKIADGTLVSEIRDIIT